MKSPIQMTVEDLAKLIAQCKELGVGCDIRLIPIDIKKEKEETEMGERESGD